MYLVVASTRAVMACGVHIPQSRWLVACAVTRRPAAEVGEPVTGVRVNTGRPRNAWQCFGIAEWPGSGFQRSSYSPVVRAKSDCAGALLFSRMNGTVRVFRCHPSTPSTGSGQACSGRPGGRGPSTKLRAGNAGTGHAVALICYSVPYFR
jgi:hypothetical protein